MVPFHVATVMLLEYSVTALEGMLGSVRCLYLDSQGGAACCYSIEGILDLHKLAAGTEGRQREGVLQDTYH